MVIIFFQALLVLGGFLYFRQLIRRWRDDFEELCEASSSDGKWRIIGLWSLVVPMLMMTFGAGQQLINGLMG